MDKDLISEEKIQQDAPQETKTKKSKAKPKLDKDIVEIKTHNYQVKVDIDKDLDLLLCCGILNRRGIYAVIDNKDILCGLYSDKNNAINQKNKIEALGYEALILEV